MTTSGTPFAIQPALTAIALRRRNPTYVLIADQVMPRLSPVGTKKFRWLEYGPGQNMTVPDTRVGRKGVPFRVEMSAAEHFDECVDYGLEDAVPLDDQTQAQASAGQGGFGIDPMARAVEAITDLLALDREIRVAATVFDPDNYGANVRILSGADQFSDFADSDPIGVVLDAMSKMLLQPNAMVFGRAAWTRFRQHPKVVKGVLANPGDVGVVSRQQVADLLEVKNIFVGEAWVNTAKPGQAVSKARVWGNHIAMLFSDPTVSADSGVTWGATQQYAAQGAVKYASTRFEPVGLRGSTIVRVGETVKEFVACPEAGYLLLNAVAG